MTVTEALRRLHGAGRVASPWLPGMLWWVGDHADGDWGRVDDAAAEDQGPPDDAEPDLTDAATVGCLLALLREASGRPYLHASIYGTSTAGVTWRVADLDYGWTVSAPLAPTEGEAIAAALVALAEAL